MWTVFCKFDSGTHSVSQVPLQARIIGLRRRRNVRFGSIAIGNQLNRKVKVPRSSRLRISDGSVAAQEAKVIKPVADTASVCGHPVLVPILNLYLEKTLGT